jgi:hypothetical protein
MLAQLFVVSAKQRCGFIASGVEGPAFKATGSCQISEVIDLTIVVSVRPRQAETAEARCGRYEVVAFPQDTDGDAVSTETTNDRQTDRRTADDDRSGAGVVSS